MAVPDWVKKELRENYGRASRAGRLAAKTEPHAARASYLAREGALRIELTNGVTITIPVALIPYLKGAAPDDIRSVEVLGRGGGLHWERLDLDLSVPALVSSIFPDREWMAELGRVGGRKSSAAKAAAARRNGRKGGRPQLQPTADR
jgi:general stress protein YciG